MGKPCPLKKMVLIIFFGADNRSHTYTMGKEFHFAADTDNGTEKHMQTAPSERIGSYPQGSVLVVAGSDSGGGAGIQADIKTIILLGGYATTAITSLTAQNTLGVQSIHAVPADFMAAQLDAVLSDITVDIIKTGMLFSGELIEVLAERLTRHRKTPVVIDPVMVAKGGKRLMDSGALATFEGRLLPGSYLVTPNIPEAECLTGLKILDEEGMVEAARVLRRMGAQNVLVKGGHMGGKDSVDILLDGNVIHRYGASRIQHGNTHGTGCTYTSAISVLLAQGEKLPMAVSRAKEFITKAILYARPMGKGHGPLNHYRAARNFGSG
jgi:hydroxymethylpyrimidine kinase/phosphomethylpyrimidine kinase/thiamine-phosphate diphosphorylase